MRVYTKKGDAGQTSLVNGERVDKWDDRVEAYGSVDELSAFLALLADDMRSDDALTEFVAELDAVGSVLMSLEAHLAAGDNCHYPLPTLKDSSISNLEASIDSMQAKLPQIDKFTIPGGCKLVSMCHVCRTICRRAERRIALVSSTYDTPPFVGIYINRLSDYLYLLGRTLASHLQAEEILWIP